MVIYDTIEIDRVPAARSRSRFTPVNFVTGTVRSGPGESILISLLYSFRIARYSVRIAILNAPPTSSAKTAARTCRDVCL